VVVELDRWKVEPERADEVGRPFAEDAVGDVDVAATGVSRLGAVHAAKS
jgi:hypothetical protein